MNLSFKRKLDTLLGYPALLLTNLAASLAGTLLRRKKTLTPVHKVVFLKFQGMGSVLIAYPAIKIIKEKFPSCQITFIGTPATAAIAQRILEIDVVEIFDDRNVFFAIKSILKLFLTSLKNRYDWAFDLEVYSKISSVLLTLTMARNRVGFAIDTVRLRKGMHTQLVFFNRYLYLGNSYLNLASCLVGQIDNNNYLSQFFKESNREWMLFSGLSEIETPPKISLRDYVVFNPQCGPLSNERKLPFEGWKRLSELILDHQMAHQIVVIGSGAFEVEQNKVYSDLPGVINLTGKLNLDQLRTCLSKAKALVSGDTFNLHYGLLLEVPVLALFGPTNPKTYFPVNLRKHSMALTLNLSCSPCVHHWEPPPCRGENHCMRALSIESIWLALGDLLRGQANGEELVLEPSHSDPRANPCLVYTRSDNSFVSKENI